MAGLAAPLRHIGSNLRTRTTHLRAVLTLAKRQAPAHPVMPRGPRATALAVVILTLVFAGFGALDVPLTIEARQLMRESPALDLFFEAITHLGLSSWILVIAAAVGLSLASLDWTVRSRETRRRFARIHGVATFVFVAVAATGTLGALVKNTIGRARPKHLDVLGHLHFDFGAYTAAFASFPSGHATTNGAFFLALALIWPHYRSVWLVAALLTGTSRVMVGAHYPSDVVAGLALGAGLTLLMARWLSSRAVLFELKPGALLPTLR